MLPEDRLLGHYRLVRRVGSGGMGEVYLAEDTRINRQVAIKVVRAETEPYPDPVAMQDTIRLFQREMRAITMLDHPHILPLFDFGEEKDGNMVFTYMVMPFRQEGSLADWLQKRGKSEKLTQDEVAHFVMQAADALQHAHDHHLIHQDVKPSNFLVRKRSNNVLPDLLLMDFGIVKMTTATATASQSIRGTPAFMAPEQWKGHPQAATDQYALAVMAYLLLTGRPPFVGRMEQVMHQHLMVQPQPPGSLNPAISPALDAVILRALEKEPDKRFPSILAFAQAFQATDNQDPTIFAPKKEQASADDRAKPEKNAQTIDTPPLPIGSAAKPDELVSTVTASGTDLSLQILTPETDRSNSGAQTPQPPLPAPDALASTSARAAKKTHLQPQIVVVLTILVIIILVVVSGVVGTRIYQNQVNADATSTALANVTATAQAQATAQVIANNPYPSYLTGNGTLAFVDPLSQEGGSKWGSYTGSAGGVCQFTGGAYHVSQQTNNYFNYCVATGTYRNFAFEVQMTITQGNCGGMIFRDDGNNHFYKFDICQQSTYHVTKYVSASGSDTTVPRSSSSSAIHTGLGQQNKITIVANGSTMTFYVNEQQIDQVQDSSYTSGSIGLIANPYYQTGSATDVTYNNARLWAL